MARLGRTGSIIVLVALAGVAGCGSSESSSGAPTSTSVGAAPAITAPASGPRSTFCVAASGLKADFDPFAAVVKGGSPDAIERGFVSAATSFGLLHAVAPAELQPAFDELQKDILAFARDVDRLKWDSTKVGSDPQTSAELADPKMLAALARVRGYLKSECRLDPVGASANLPN